MSVKLGVAPIAWSNDDMPELGGDTTLEQCLDEASQAGYIGVESGGKFPKKSSELIPKLNKYKLHLCSGWYGANLRKNSVRDEKELINVLINKKIKGAALDVFNLEPLSKNSPLFNLNNVLSFDFFERSNAFFHCFLSMALKVAFAIEKSFFDSIVSFFLTAIGKLILHKSTYLISIRNILCCNTHVAMAERILKRS